VQQLVHRYGLDVVLAIPTESPATRLAKFQVISPSAAEPLESTPVEDLVLHDRRQEPGSALMKSLPAVASAQTAGCTPGDVEGDDNRRLSNNMRTRSRLPPPWMGGESWRPAPRVGGPVLLAEKKPGLGPVKRGGEKKKTGKKKKLQLEK